MGRLKDTYYERVAAVGLGPFKCASRVCAVFHHAYFLARLSYGGEELADDATPGDLGMQHGGW